MVVVARLPVAVCDLHARDGWRPKERHRNKTMRFEMLVLTIDRELEARVPGLVPTERKYLAWIGSAAGSAPPDVPVLAYFIIIRRMASAPLQRVEVHAGGHRQNSHREPHSVRARMSRSFSVTGITFLQAKKSPRWAGLVVTVCG